MCDRLVPEQRRLGLVYVPNPERIAGLSRADTSRAIAEDLIGAPDDGT
ncbi:MAG: hypothetical protein ACR2HR_03295 [Euzebya sp.]